MASMLLVNPLPKRKRKAGKRKVRKSHHKPESKVMAKAKRKHSKKRRSPAQKAATARMLAARGHKRSKRRTHSKKRRSIVRVTSRRSTVQGQPVTARGVARSRKRKISGYSANPMRKHRRHGKRRSNPLSLKAFPQTAKKVAVPVALGVALSIVMDKLLPKVPVPAMLQVAGKEKMLLGYTVLVRTAAIIGAGLLARKATSRDNADGAMIAALGVTYTDLARSMIPGHLATTAAMSGYDSMAGYDMSGFDMGQKALNGDANYMGGYDKATSVNAINSHLN